MSNRPMKALTVCQPYAHLLVVGEKPIENRTWPTSYRGPLLIHAGKSRAWLEDRDEARYPGLVFGAFVGSVVLVDCVPVNRLPADLSDNEHANGPWCWVVRDHVRFATPVEARGAQGLWDVDAARVTAVGDAQGPRWSCSTCGPVTRTDEDGCCAGCGANCAPVPEGSPT